MTRSRRIRIALMTAALATGSVVGFAGDPPQGSALPDPGLLEFLGTVGPPVGKTQPDDAGWLACLSEINIGKVAKASQSSPQTPAQPKPGAGSNAPAGATGKPGASGVQNDD